MLQASLRVGPQVCRPAHDDSDGLRPGGRAPVAGSGHRLASGIESVRSADWTRAHWQRLCGQDNEARVAWPHGLRLAGTQASPVPGGLGAPALAVYETGDEGKMNRMLRCTALRMPGSW